MLTDLGLPVMYRLREATESFLQFIENWIELFDSPA